MLVVAFGLWLQLREIKKMMTLTTKEILAKIDADTNALSGAVSSIATGVSNAIAALKTPPTDDPDLIAWCNSHATALESATAALGNVSSALQGIGVAPVTPPADGAPTV